MTHALEFLLQGDLPQRFGWGLLHSLWQIAVLAGLYFLVRPLIPRERLAWRYRFGYVVLLAMLALPIVTAAMMPVNDFLASRDVENQAEEGRAVSPRPPLESASDVPMIDDPSSQNGGHGVTALPWDMTSSANRSPSGAVSMAEFIDIVGEEAVAEAFREAEAESKEPGLERSATSGPDAGSLELGENLTQNNSTLHTPNSTLSLTRYLWILTLAWLLGVSFLSARLAGGLLGIGRLRRSGRPLPTDEWDLRLAELCRRLQVGRNVRLLVSRAIDSPVLIGMFRPVVLVPLSFLSGFSPEEVEAILVHELAHVRRHDYLANLVQMLIETLLFYHPLLWLVSTAVRDDREYLCDEFVVRRHGTDSLFYAKTLTNLEQFRQSGGKDMKRAQFTPAAAARPLLNRVRHILGLKKESDRTCGGMAGLTLLIVLLLSPLAFAFLQEGGKSVEFGVGSVELGDAPEQSNSATAAESLPGENDSQLIQTPMLQLNPASTKSGENVMVYQGQEVMASDNDGTMTDIPMNSAIVGDATKPTRSGGGAAFGNTPTNVPAEASMSSAFELALPASDEVPNRPMTSQEAAAAGLNANLMASSPNSTLHTPHSTLPPLPLTGKLYSVQNALELFELEAFIRYLEDRLPDSGTERCQIYQTRRNALLLTATDEVHAEMAKIMAEIDEIVESEAFLHSLEMNAKPQAEIKVFKIKHTQANLLLSVFQTLQIDPQMLITADYPTNSLIIKAPYPTLKTVQTLLEELDTEPAVTPAQRATQYYSYGYSLPLFGTYPNDPASSDPGSPQPQPRITQGGPAAETSSPSIRPIPAYSGQTQPTEPTLRQPVLPPGNWYPDSLQQQQPQNLPTPSYAKPPIVQPPQRSAPVSRLPVVKPDPGVQFMSTTEAGASSARYYPESINADATTSAPESAENTKTRTIYRMVEEINDQGETVMRLVPETVQTETQRITPGTGTGTAEPSTPAPRTGTVTITRKVQETTPDGEAVEREVIEEIPAGSVLPGSRRVTTPAYGVSTTSKVEKTQVPKAESPEDAPKSQER